MRLLLLVRVEEDPGLLFALVPIAIIFLIFHINEEKRRVEEEQRKDEEHRRQIAQEERREKLRKAQRREDDRKEEQRREAQRREVQRREAQRQADKQRQVERQRKQQVLMDDINTALNNKAWERRKLLMRAMNAVQSFTGNSFIPFGSFVDGTFTCDSDLDMRMKRAGKYELLNFILSFFIFSLLLYLITKYELILFLFHFHLFVSSV